MFDQAKYRTPVSKYVVQPPDIIFKNEMISEVVEKFEESRAWNLPVVDKNNRYLGFVSKSSILEAYRQQIHRNHRGVTFPSSLRGVGCCVTVLRQLPGVFRSGLPRPVLSACPVLGRRAFSGGSDSLLGLSSSSFPRFSFRFAAVLFSVCPDKVPQRVTISVPVIKGIENNTIIYVVVLLFEVSYYCMFSLRRTGRTDGE